MKRSAIAITLGLGTVAAGCILEDNPAWVPGSADTGGTTLTSGADETGTDEGESGGLDSEGTDPTGDDATTTTDSGDGSSEGGVDTGELGDVCPWGGAEFSHRSRLAIDGRDIRASFAGFAVMVRLTPDRFEYAAAGADGSDLRFFADDGTPLAFEIEAWSEAASVAWVRVIDLEPGQSTNFWMCYGATSAPAPPDPVEVWDGDDRGVWHLGDLQDSSTHANHAVNAGTVDGEGLVGAARSFAGAGERLEVPIASSLQITGSLTVSALVRYASFDEDPNSNTILVHGASGNGSGSNVLYRFEYEPSSLGSDAGVWLTWQSGNQNHTLVKSPSVPLLQVGDWHHLVVVRDAAAKTVTFYADGAAVGAPKAFSADASGGTDGALMVGANPSSPGAYNFAGEIDEVRVSASARSSDYVALDFKSVSDALLVYGPVETNP